MMDLASKRPEVLDPFFRFLHYFDTPYFFFLLIPIIWLGHSYQWGMRVFYWGSLNSLLISLFKNAIQWPRPSTDLPSIGLYHPSSFGFPSGGAQTCMFLGILLIYYWRTKAAWIVGILYIGLISFSRLYLAVHYPIDVLGGWAIAAILAALCIWFTPKIEALLKKKGLRFSLVVGVAIPLALLIVTPNRGIDFVMSSVIGISIGSYLSLKYHLFLPKPKNLIEGVGRSFIAIAVVLTVILLIPHQQTILGGLSLSLFFSLAASPICRWLSSKTVSY